MLLLSLYVCTVIIFDATINIISIIINVIFGCPTPPPFSLSFTFHLSDPETRTNYMHTGP